MFNNQSYPASIGKAGWTKKDPTIGIRIDIEIPVRDYALLHSELGELMRFFFMYDNSKKYEFALDTKPCNLVFAPLKNDFESGEHTTTLHEIQLDKNLVVTKAADEETGEVKHLLQLKTTIANTTTNAGFLVHYVDKNVFCQILEAQTELELDRKDSVKVTKEEFQDMTK